MDKGPINGAAIFKLYPKVNIFTHLFDEVNQSKPIALNFTNGTINTQLVLLMLNSISFLNDVDVDNN